MKKEDADQLIRCVKECWWRLLIFASVLLMFVTLVVYGWPAADLGFGWGAVGAVGTIVTGGAAVFIAWMQSRWMEQSRKRDYFKVIHKLSSALSYFSFIFEEKFLKGAEGKDSFIEIFISVNLPKAEEDLRAVYENSNSNLLSNKILSHMNSLLVACEILQKAGTYKDDSFYKLEAMAKKVVLRDAQPVLESLYKLVKSEVEAISAENH
ncbi:hypothetical protein [Alcaligenes sp. CHO6]|uniref:hypothetical protein n=1 Tax=Alcaligenes sp. CHO6 TaxID=3123298 RepID=UPI00301541AF